MRDFYFVPIGMRSVAISMSAICMYVRLSVCLFVCSLAYHKTHTPKFHQNAPCMLPVSVARSSPDGYAIRYVGLLLVLLMTSCFHIMETMGQNQRRRVWFVQFASWRHRREVCRLRLHLVCYVTDFVLLFLTAAPCGIHRSSMLFRSS